MTSSRARRRGARGLAALLGLVVVATVAAGCLPASPTEQGRAVEDLWTIFLVPAIAVSAVVWGLITWSIVRHRRRPTTTGLPPQFHGSVPLEIAWTAGPIILVAILFGATLVALGRIDSRATDAVPVTVTGFRWQWQVDYPAAGVTVVGTPDDPLEMVVPVGRPVHVTLEATDVVHSFYVPVFLFKRDAIPGRTSEFDLTVEEAGTYGGQCAEFCGIFHDQMTLTVRAVPEAEFEAWLAGQGGGTGPSGAPATDEGFGASPSAETTPEVDP